MTTQRREAPQEASTVIKLVAKHFRTAQAPYTYIYISRHIDIFQVENEILQYFPNNFSMPTLRSINTVIRQYTYILHTLHTTHKCTIYISSRHIFALPTSDFCFAITAHIICIIVFCKRIASIFKHSEFYVVCLFIPTNQMPYHCSLSE